MTTTRQELAREAKYIKRLERQGWSKDRINSWIRGWRAVGLVGTSLP